MSAAPSGIIVDGMVGGNDSLKGRGTLLEVAGYAGDFDSVAANPHIFATPTQNRRMKEVIHACQIGMKSGFDFSSVVRCAPWYSLPLGRFVDVHQYVDSRTENINAQYHDIKNGVRESHASMYVNFPNSIHRSQCT